MSWTPVRLSDVIEKPLSGEWGDGEGTVKVLRTTNFTNDGTIDFSDVVERAISNKKVDQKKLIFGDTIIEKSGGSPSQPVGRVVFFDKPNDIFLCNNFTSVLRPKSAIDGKYLFWFLFNNHVTKNTLKYQNKTTGIINLQLERYISEIQIPLPPLSTQKRIAAILDTADALRRKDQELLRKYDELAQAIFIDMFGDPLRNEKGWEVKKLGDYIKSLDAGVSVNSTEEVNISKPSILKTSCVYSGQFNPSEAKVIAERDIHRVKMNPKKDSIIISRMNTTDLVGKCAYISENHENLYLPDRLWQTSKTNIEHSVLWLCYAIQTHKFMESVSKISSGTSGSMKNITKSEYLNLPIIYPDYKLQLQFEKLLLNINNQKSFGNITLSEFLFNSLLQKSFKGELIA